MQSRPWRLIAATILLSATPSFSIDELARAEVPMRGVSEQLFTRTYALITRDGSSSAINPVDACATTDRVLASDRPALPRIQGPLTLHGWDNPWSLNTFKKDLYWFLPGNVNLLHGALVFTVTEGASGQAQTHENQKSAGALFEIDATTARGVAGLVQSPLYLFGDDAHEVDFEILGDKGLQLAIHTKERFNAYQKLIPGDFSGRRRYAIEYRANTSVIWFVDGRQVGCATPQDTGGIFPRNPLKPFVETWPTANASWAGTWTFTPSTMIVHGYRRTLL